MFHAPATDQKFPQTFLLAEPGRTVAAVRTGNEVAFIVIIIQLGEHGHHRVSPGISGRSLRSGSRNCMNGADRKITSCGTHIVCLVLLRFETHHGANCVFVEGAGIIGGSGSNHLLVCSTVFVDIPISTEPL